MHMQNYSKLLSEMQFFVSDEQEVAESQLRDIWRKPIEEKLDKGLTQGFTHLERTEDSGYVWAYLDGSDSRFREGDMVALHQGNPLEKTLARQVTIEHEDESRWLLRFNKPAEVLELFRELGNSPVPCYADPDALDLTPLYEAAIKDISITKIGQDIVLPMLAGDLDITFDEANMSQAEDIAIAEGFNAKQAEAVGLALGAEQMACIQGPPGTGKTRVLALIARLMVARGERILVTSHTHMAINNALNKIHAQGVPTVKIGRYTQRKGLDESVTLCEEFKAWRDRPDGGYVVGATPFATCSQRLSKVEFDTIIFDEASQITTPLALMAMRTGKRFIFIGDQKQLPPVMLSRSVLDKDTLSAFSVLTAKDTGHTVMLSDTYRMNRWLTAWPSGTYYDHALQSAGANRERQLLLSKVPERLASVFTPDASGVFIPTLDKTARSRNHRDANLVVELCAAAVEGGLMLDHIGVVTPYRAQGRAIRNALSQRFGLKLANQVIADTVERMQGQERELIILSLATGDEAYLTAVAGFFFQPERLNVSITRAMSKLIVIGPYLTSKPDSDNEMLNRWVAQYIDFIHSLKRVEL
jgi:DNA replication ATP-dependent helicase Dna2